MGFEILMQGVKEKNSAIVVGIDPAIERFPLEILEVHQTVYDRLFAFSKAVIDGVSPHVPAIKFQSAYFEANGIEGMTALRNLIKYAKSEGLFVIADAKRGDIGSTANAYAKAFLEPGRDFESDALTINPYLGDDSNNEFYKQADAYDKGVFVLVKTSNPTSGQLQNLEVNGSSIYEHVARMISENAARGIFPSHKKCEYALEINYSEVCKLHFPEDE
jgi:orotidine-5'-phosphate decarboxylase